MTVTAETSAVLEQSTLDWVDPAQLGLTGGGVAGLACGDSGLGACCGGSALERIEDRRSDEHHDQHRRYGDDSPESGRSPHWWLGGNR